jgi:hypothetical protein
MAQGTTLKSGDATESSIQKALMEWVRLRPSIAPFVLHIPNEGKRTYNYGRLLKSMGMRPGVADLFIAIPRHGFGGAWIELKSAKGRLSFEQEDFLDDMSQQNFFTKVCWSLDEAIETVSWYCFWDGKISGDL